MPPQQPFAIPTKPQMNGDRSKEIGSRLFYLITLAIAFTAFMNAWAPLSGSVSLLVRNADGTKSVQSYSLSSRTATVIAGVNPNNIEGSSARLYQRPDGSVIGLTQAGVVMADAKNRTTVLVASPVPPTLRTPFTVWGGGEKIAWMSPADTSIQIFTRSERGVYLPVLLDKSLQPSSLGFTEDGSVLVIARLSKEGTDIYGVPVSGGAPIKIGSLSGLATIIPTP